jgi:glutathione S-transferase
MVLVLGNKNYSTWSWRAWLAFESFQIPREEIIIPLDQPDTEKNILKYSPSGRVPCLMDGETTVWDSLAICEYLAELFPDKQMWPDDRRARARARSVCAEMHSSFQELRKAMPGNIKLRKKVEDLSLEVTSDINRIAKLWNECLAANDSTESFLFGSLSIADFFYAPIVLRFKI